MREVVILSIGSVWHAPYEVYAHRALARRAGFGHDAVEALATGRTCVELAYDEAIAQTVALQIGGDRRISEAAYRKAVEAFGIDGVVALLFLAGAYGLTCTILNAFAVPAPGEDRYGHATLGQGERLDC